MKVALLADIHGNDLALNAVLNAAKKYEVEKLLIAGDFVGYYYHPEKVFELLNDWSWTAVSGNHEAMLDQWHKGINRSEIKKKYGSGIKQACKLLTSDNINVLINLPSVRRIQIDHHSVILCHGSPWDRDQYVYPDAKLEVNRHFFEEEFSLSVFGHTHYPVIWQQGNKTVVNPGSVGQPRDRIPGACWALWDTELHKVSLMREKYDISPLVKECKQYDSELPYLIDVLKRT